MSSQYRKIPLQIPTLNQYPVYSDKIYYGHEPFKIVGIRNDSVELEGNWSGGTHAVGGTSWVPLNEIFVIKKMCLEELKPNGCQVHNVNCCGGGNIINKHIEYWKEEK